jgi:hypothetical protein
MIEDHDEPEGEDEPEPIGEMPDLPGMGLAQAPPEDDPDPQAQPFGNGVFANAGVAQPLPPAPVNVGALADNDIGEMARFYDDEVNAHLRRNLQAGMAGRIAYANACGLCARIKLDSGRVVGVGPAWRLRNRYWVVLRDNLRRTRLYVFVRWADAFPAVCSTEYHGRPPPRAPIGDRHLDPVAVFHGWSTLDEVRAFLRGVDRPDLFHWDGNVVR